MTKAEYIERVRVALNTEKVLDLTQSDYLDALETIHCDIEGMMEAVRGEMAEDE